MSKIICDICGTTYPDTAECCPICGCSRDSAMDFLGEEVDLGELGEELRTGKGRYTEKKRREIFDFDEVNAEEDNTVVLDEDGDDEYEQGNDRPSSNIFAIIGLTVLIAVLLMVSAFLLFRYILPGMNSAPETAAETQALATEPPATTEYAIPCQSLALNSGGEAVLTQEGQYFLIHVGVIPENTTDKVTYVSANEAIATVTEDGRITAVSEGETEIYIVCGSFQQTCKVICEFVEDTIPTEEETVAAAGDGEAAEAAETGEGAETAAATEETVPGIRTDVKLKLKKTDITLGVYYEFQLLLDCDLAQDEVEWRVEHSHIASVDKEGNVKALKNGTTEVVAKYGDQEARCIVRCG